MSWNACTWHELADLTFNGPSTNLLDQSPDGQKLITQVATENVVDWVYSKTQIFLATLSTQNQPRGKSSLFSEVEHSFPSVGCARSKRQCLTVLQNQKLFRWMLVWEWTGPPALDLWDVVTEVLRSSKSTESPTRGGSRKMLAKSHLQTQTKGNRDLDQLSHVDYVTTNANSSQGESQLYIFEDNEAVIKIIIKGRSPTIRHVSRTHRVALDWLFDKIHLDPQIQIKYVDTKNQLADNVDQRNFTRDEWNHLLCLFNIMNFSIFSCSHFLSNRKQRMMSMKSQESSAKEVSAVAKTRPMDLVSRNFQSAKKILRKIRALRAARWIKSWIRVLCDGAPGNWCETTAKTQQHILKSGNKMTIQFGAPGNWCGAVSLQVQGAPGNRCGVMTIKSKGQGWNSTICRSPTDGILRKSSRTCNKSWISQKRHQYSTWRQQSWSGDSLCRQRWKPVFILDQITMKILERYRNINFEQLKNLFDITQRLILEHEADTSTQIPSYAWERCKIFQEQTKDGTLNSKNFNSPVLTKNCLESMENRFDSE